MELTYAVLLVLLAAALLIAEFFLVSFGVLSLGALAAAGGAIYYAFAANDVIGWLFVVLLPLFAAATTRWGLRKVAHSRAVVPQAEITGDAGYHHVTAKLGIEAGSVGVMITAGRPAGRARFDGGECDVYGRGVSLERGMRVVVVAIDGPTVSVLPAPDGNEQEPGTAGV